MNLMEQDPNRCWCFAGDFNIVCRRNERKGEEYLSRDLKEGSFGNSLKVMALWICHFLAESLPGTSPAPRL